MADDDLSDQPLPKVGQQVPAPAQQTMPPEMAAARQSVLQGIMNLTGARDAAAALRGEMTPEQQQMFMATAALGLIPGAKFAEPAAEAAAQTVAKGIRAFHGSPYDFAKFDLSNIGTGEGAQVYGHGLYFAENPAVAAEYRRQLAGGYEKMVGGQPYDSSNPQHLAASLADTFNAKGQGRAVALRAIRGDLESDIANPNLTPERRGVYQQTLDILASDKPLLDVTKPLRGKTYEVNINADPEHFLDWDKPLNEQSAGVRDALTKMRPNAPYTGTGQQIYSDLRDKWLFGSKGSGDSRADVTEELRGAGIPGIKYLDQGSRAYFQVEPHEFLNGEQGFKVNGPKGDVTFDTKAEAQQFADNLNKGKSAPTHNYVVFDDKLIDIIKKYGLAGLIAANASNWSPKKK
jgi:hypothetical protein